jgi:glutamate/tyrosine decarboxylase-like PLP-dependent enzyme
MLIDNIRDDFAKLQREIASGPILPDVSAEEIRAYLGARYDFTATTNLDEVIVDVEQMLRTWQVQVTHPRYFGLFNPSVTLASVVADTLVAMYNSQLANWRTSPAANEIERHTLRWLTSKFGLPEDSVASFTSGGMEANLSAAVVALTRAFPDYGEDGLQSLSASPAIYLTKEAHHGYNKIAHMTGLGRRALRIVATDRHLRMDMEDLERQVVDDRRNGLAPFMAVGTAGTTTAGVIDPLPEIGGVCRREGLWFHVDAAWGGSAILSPQLRHYLAGIDEADSITCDAHKWLSVPMGCGMFFCRHAESVAEAFRAEVSYMPGKKSGPVRDPYTTSAQWSRRFIGLKLFMALANHGESGYVEMIDHQANMGDVLRKSLMNSGWKIVNSTPLPLVCFTRDGLDTTKFLAALHERQIAWMSPVEIAGTPAVRACITSFRTTETDVRWVVSEMNQLFEQQYCRTNAMETTAAEPIGMNA